MTLLHVICGLPPPPQSKILATPMTQVVVFPLVFFQLLSATGRNRFLTNVCSISYAKQYEAFKHYREALKHIL